MKCSLLGLAGLLCFMWLCPAGASAGGLSRIGDDSIINDPASWGAVNVHDPTLVKDGKVWYTFSTDASVGDVHACGIQVRRSEDLVNWKYLGTAFSDYATDCAAEISAAGMNPGAHDGLWAPEVIRVGDVWRMYYSASTYGSSRSCIGLAESECIEGPYQDKGIVIRSDSNAVNGPNAIDPCVFTDVDGAQYMTYGSFFGGIFLVALGEDGCAIGKPARIAGYRGCRAEGSFLLYLPQTRYYYLFLSYGSLSSDYNIRVGRSREIGGPYVDAAGNSLTNLVAGNEDHIGVKLMGGYQLRHDPGTGFSKGIKAPGHCSVYADGDLLLLCHHTRTATYPGYWFGMQVRQMALNAWDWPVVMPMSVSPEEAFEPIDVLPDGVFNLVRHGTQSNAEPIRSERVTLRGGVVEGLGEARLYDGWHVLLTLDGVPYDGVCLWQRDDEREGWTLSISAMSEDGMCVWLSGEDLYPWRP